MSSTRQILFLVMLLKIVSILGFLQKSENCDVSVDTYVYLLCYLAVIGFTIYRDYVLYEVGAEHTNLTIKHGRYKMSSLTTY
jgi:hypothetical protein